MKATSSPRLHDEVAFYEPWETPLRRRLSSWWGPTMYLLHLLHLPTLITLSANNKPPKTQAAIGHACLFFRSFQLPLGDRLLSRASKSGPGTPLGKCHTRHWSHPCVIRFTCTLSHTTPSHALPIPFPTRTHHDRYLQYAAEEPVYLHCAAVGFLDGQKETSPMSCLCPIPHLLAVPREWPPLPPPSLPVKSIEYPPPRFLLFHFPLVLFDPLSPRFPISRLTRPSQEGQGG